MADEPSGRQPSTSRRSHTRGPVRLAAVLVLGDDIRLEGEASNISFGGAFLAVSVEHSPEPGSTGKLSLTAGDGEPPIVFSCEVRRTDTSGIGLKFIHTNLEGFEQFAQLVLESTEDPHQTLGELRVSPGFRVITDEGMKNALE
ncbi:MAG: PilZ domain-containing protein [Leptospirillia bacterium]